MEKNFSVHTVKEYERDITQFLRFLKAEGINDLREVEYIHARLFVTKLYEEKLSRTSISRKISSIRIFFRFLNRDYGIDDSPFLSLYHPKKEKLLPNFFYEDELAQLFEANEGDDSKSLRNMALLELLYATGIRVSECTSIELDRYRFSLFHSSGDGKREKRKNCSIWAICS